MEEEHESPPPEGGAGLTSAASDVREGLFTVALEQADRMVHTAEAMRLQVMLAGFDAMLIEEEAEGRAVRGDDAVVRAFLLHQGTVLRTSSFAVQQQLTVGRELRDRLPLTWAVFLDGGCSLRSAGIAVDQLEGLTDEQVVVIDAAAADLVTRERPGMVERKLVKLREAIAPEAAIGRAEQATGRRHVSAKPEPDGQGVLIIRTTAVDVAAMYDVIRQAAVAAHGREGETRQLGQLMADVAVDLVLQAAASGGIAEDDPAYPMERIGPVRVPGRKPVEATILVTVNADVATGAANGPASVAGMGSVDADVARRIVQHTRTWTRVAVDPVEDVVLGIDTHERYIPAGLKKLIHARNDTCVGDDCGLPAHRADLDHVQRFEHDGRTRATNLQPLCRRSHQLKDDHFDVRSVDGIVRWRSRWGSVREVRPALRLRTPEPSSGEADDCPF